MKNFILTIQNVPEDTNIGTFLTGVAFHASNGTKEENGPSGSWKLKLVHPGEMKAYHLQLQHDNGIQNITTSATSYQNAIEKVMEAEGCPEHAILKIWT